LNGIPVIFGKKGRTTIPLPLRRRLGWQAGDTIRFRLDGDKVVVSRQETGGRHQEAGAAPARSVLPLILALLLGGADDG
jgi:AbrB family looped-hinge helix DNA binding protein